MRLIAAQRWDVRFLHGLPTPGESAALRLGAHVLTFAYQRNKKKHIRCLDDWEMFYWKQIKPDNHSVKWPHTILFSGIAHLYFYGMATIRQLSLLQEALETGSGGEENGNKELMACSAESMRGVKTLFKAVTQEERC